MSRFDSLNVIRLYEFYLATMFVISFARRYLVYLDFVRLCVKFIGRWPKLMAKLKELHGVLVTKAVIQPLLIALCVIVIQMICSRLVWPQAEVTGESIRSSLWKMTLLGTVVIPMFLVDAYFLIRVGRFNLSTTEDYLDQAEHWLATWKAPTIRVLTFGYINPQLIVKTEVTKGLTQLGETLSWASWWVIAQTSLRVLVGLTIWLMWAFARE